MDASVAERGVSPGSVLTFFANTWEVRNPKVEVRKKSERPMQCKNPPLPLRRKAFGGQADPLLSRREEREKTREQFFTPSDSLQ